MSIAEIKAMVSQNASAARLEARTPAKAFPTSDRPRSAADLANIRLHFAKNVISSPIVILSDEPSAPILLDGMHRLVAAAIGRRRVRVCLVRLKNP
jgi:hypothetical protein